MRQEKIFHVILKLASEYQEQTIETARELADNFLESQKQILSSLQSAWLPQIDEQIEYLRRVGCLLGNLPRYMQI